MTSRFRNLGEARAFRYPPPVRSLLPVLAFVLVAASARGEEDPAAAWAGLKKAWAADHLKLADEQLKAQCPGFADTQAGLAAQLLGADAPELKAYAEKRGKLKEILKGWLEADWKAYEAKREPLHKKHAERAVALLAKAPPDLAKEIEGWALRLDPDQPKLRAQRKETLVEGLGWVSSEAAEAWKKAKGELKPGATWKEAYEVPTEHFRVKTTLPPDKALPLVADLEALCRIWIEVFEGVAAPKFEVKDEIWILAGKDDYLACVEANGPEGLDTARAPGTLGFAMTNHKSFFYDLPNNKPTLRSILMHEASHLMHYQLSGEVDSTYGPWSTEGMAMLMESLDKATTVDWNAAVSVLNNPKADYLTGARKTIIDDPVAIIDMDRQAFYVDHRRELVFAYAHGCGFCFYLMYAEGGRWRQGALKYLLAMNAGKGPTAFEECFPGLDRKTLGLKAPPYLKAMGGVK